MSEFTNMSITHNYAHELLSEQPTGLPPVKKDCRNGSRW